MRDVFHSFLEERGVNESLFPFLQAWIYVKDHRNLLRWFKSVGTESEEYILDEGDDDDDLEEEHETQVHPEAEPEVKKAPEVPAPPKEPERQLSKKELKQKEQAEFSRFWSCTQQWSRKLSSKKRKKENTVGESKASKKKKKKDKQKEVKESQDEVKTNSDAAAEEQEETSSSMFIKEGVVQCNVFERAKGEVALTASGGFVCTMMDC
ncbi:unnamed protein product [Brassica oleracea var. botrytis]